MLIYIQWQHFWEFSIWPGIQNNSIDTSIDPSLVGNTCIYFENGTKHIEQQGLKKPWPWYFVGWQYNFELLLL